MPKLDQKNKKDQSWQGLEPGVLQALRVCQDCFFCFFGTVSQFCTFLLGSIGFIGTVAAIAQSAAQTVRVQTISQKALISSIPVSMQVSCMAFVFVRLPMTTAFCLTLRSISKYTQLLWTQVTHSQGVHFDRHAPEMQHGKCNFKLLHKSLGRVQFQFIGQVLSQLPVK